MKKTEKVTVKVRSQISACTPVLLNLAKKHKLKATLGKTPSGMDEVALVGSPELIKVVRSLWVEKTAVKPTVTRFPTGKRNSYHGAAAILTLERFDIILVAPSREALAIAGKALIKCDIKQNRVQLVNVTKQ